MEAKYIFYFLIGGAMVSLITYLAGSAKGLLAAFFANLPIITFITFLTIYADAGEKAVVDYARYLIIMVIPWFAYIFSVIFLTQRIGFIPSLALGLVSYFMFSYLIMTIKK